MTVLLFVLLTAALLGLLWGLRRQNRALEHLREAVRRGQPLLREESSAGGLPAWPALTETVNLLITDNTALRQHRTHQLAHLEATLGNLPAALPIVDQSHSIHLPT